MEFPIIAAQCLKLCLRFQIHFLKADNLLCRNVCFKFYTPHKVNTWVGSPCRTDLLQFSSLLVSSSFKMSANCWHRTINTFVVLAQNLASELFCLY